MFLPILEEERRVELGEAGYPGLTAVYRPMDLTEKARWFDACDGNIDTAEAKVDAVRRQLLRIEGLDAKETDGSVVPFDGTNPAHFKRLPMGIVLPVYVDLITRTALNEEHRKN